MQISQEQYNKLPERLQKHFSKGNTHPTIKNVKLMEYLIKMITPKNGIVLDPFAGSGSTLVAAKENGFQYVGIELTEEYLPIIQARTGCEIIKPEITAKKIKNELDKEIIIPMKTEMVSDKKTGKYCPNCGGKIKGKYCEDCFWENV